jgi:ankyrin repeat protein
MTWPRDDGRWNWFLVQPIRGHDRAEHEGLFQCMRLLVERGLDVNLPNQHGEAVLHYTMADGDPTEEQRLRFVELLLDTGARLDLRDVLLKSTPLGWAARWGRKEVVELLLKRGAPAQEPDAEAWATPLAWATKQGNAEIAAELRSHGALA